MTESLFNTYIRLRRNVIEAKEKFNKEPTAENDSMVGSTTKAFQDFCVIFTENMLNAAGQTMDEVKFI